jgi:hypothetical protein
MPVLIRALTIWGLLLCMPALSFSQETCPSEAKLTIKSSNYSGLIKIELRKGRRPGSRVIGTRSINTSGTVVFKDICPGTYFYAFSTPDSEQVSTTRYFEVVSDDDSYSMPEITVTYSRASSSAGNKVGSAKKSEL